MRCLPTYFGSYVKNFTFEWDCADARQAGDDSITGDPRDSLEYAFEDRVSNVVPNYLWDEIEMEERPSTSKIFTQVCYIAPVSRINPKSLLINLGPGGPDGNSFMKDIN